MHPFIEAEKQAGHNVKRACELLKVSRAAFYTRRTATPGSRAVRDTELTEKITKVHETSRGTYGAPRVHAALHRDGDRCGRRRVARLMRQAGLEGRHRRRRHRTTIPDPVPPPGRTWSCATSRPTRPPSTRAGAATSPTSPPTRAGST
ncbi:IS3 family transposase [Kitasatospora aureofaciens]|uniref:IS3 family transposase n=1 Tax=Kitasatospora aureofaciens TaxID=1894 RepID=UPI0037C76844